MTTGGVITIVQNLFNTKALVPALGVITTDIPIIDATVTWNNGSVVFHGLKLDITDSASDATSRLFEALVNTTPVFRILKTGATTMFSTLTLAADPVAALEAATKQYVDNRIVMPTVEIFPATGTWTKPAGLLYSRIRAIGSGAGGGGVDLAAGNTAVGGGGGAGAYAESIIIAATLGATEAVTVAAAGVGGVTGGAAGQTGVDGGTVSFGAHVIAVGGSGGLGTTTNGSIGDGGVGGLAASCTGTIKISGGDGDAGYIDVSNTSSGGVGGVGIMGSRNRATILTAGGTTAVGTAGRVYGGGGNGAAVLTSATLVAGGAGALGAVFVENFLA
jgi:hypothetical protein